MEFYIIGYPYKAKHMDLFQRIAPDVQLESHSDEYALVEVKSSNLAWDAIHRAVDYHEDLQEEPMYMNFLIIFTLLFFVLFLRTLIQRFTSSKSNTKGDDIGDFIEFDE